MYTDDERLAESIKEINEWDLPDDVKRKLIEEVVRDHRPRKTENEIGDILYDVDDFVESALVSARRR